MVEGRAPTRAVAGHPMVTASAAPRIVYAFGRVRRGTSCGS